LIATMVFLAVGGAAVWAMTAPAEPFDQSDRRLRGQGDPERGRLVFAAGDCASCHARPGQSDRLNLGGGIALASPFGTFRAPNISSHSTDGIGKWTASDLANALIKGVSPRGEHYYPAFPYPSFTGMRLEDVNDLMAYLKTLPAVSGRPPPHDVSMIFRIRRLVGAWKFMFFHEGRTPAPSGDPIRDRGAYLVEAVAHCAECHSSRNLLGAIRQETRFAGGPDPEGVGFVPNITPGRISDWSEADIARLLTAGLTPNHGRIGSSMSDVVFNTTSLPETDRIAIARYIKSLPPRPTPHP
jgi:mono/diheme cytochrome c family protein